MCQQLFEKSGPVVENARFLSNRPPSLELNAYSIAINGTYCWITIPLDQRPSALKHVPIPFSARATAKTLGSLSSRAATRLENCREYYKGSGVRLGPGIVGNPDVPTTRISEETRQRRAVIAALVEFTSPLGQLVGALTRDTLYHMCDGGTAANKPLPTLNPLVQAGNGQLRNYTHGGYIATCGANIEYGAAGSQHLGAQTIPVGMLEAGGSQGDQQQLVVTTRHLQIKDILSLPSVAIVLHGMSATADEVAGMDSNVLALHYPKIKYFVEL